MTSRKEVVPDDREEGSAPRQSQGERNPADAAGDRRGQEDRLADLQPLWWERDPDLLAQEVRALEVAGFRIHHRNITFERAGLQLYLDRDGEQFTVTYRCGFPLVGTLVSRGWSAPTPDAPVVGSGFVRMGAAVVALTELIHGHAAKEDFSLVRFGALLLDPWLATEHVKSGALVASVSGRGDAVLVSGIRRTAKADALFAAALLLRPAFDQPISGWWVQGNPPDWHQGPEAVATAIERAVVRRHKLRPDALTRTPAPILGLTWPADDSLLGVHWQFIRRIEGRLTFGTNHLVLPDTFRVRAPYAVQLADHRVAIVGCGSLGWPIAIGLARAGVRRFALFDADRLVPGNLARLGAQLAQVGEHKVHALRSALLQVAGGMDVSVHPSFLGVQLESRGLAAVQPTLIIDAAADESTPNQVNAAALVLEVPALYAWMTRGVRNARIFRVVPGRTPCYACVAWAKPRSLVLEERSQAHEFTWIGANFNIDPIAAAAVRMAVRTLCADPVDATNPDHIVLRVGGPVPVAEALDFRRDPRCRWCGQ
jgi:molybdopterin/thiamine biosynthesis adenylyltransferase